MTLTGQAGAGAVRKLQEDDYSHVLVVLKGVNELGIASGTGQGSMIR